MGLEGRLSSVEKDHHVDFKVPVSQRMLGAAGVHPVGWPGRMAPIY